MVAPTPIDRDAINPNFLDMLANLQARVEVLERQAASGLFDNNDVMTPPAGLIVDNGNLEVIGNRGIFNSTVNVGSEIELTIDTGEITKTQTYHRVAAETGTTDQLDTINGGIDGDLIIIIPRTGDTITIREVGNIVTQGSSVNVTDTERWIAIFNADTDKWVSEVPL
jgi:hypothetical protein